MKERKKRDSETDTENGRRAMLLYLAKRSDETWIV